MEQERDQLRVMLVNGSPHRDGNTYIALSEAARALESEGVATEIVHIGNRAVQGCIACHKCADTGRCVFNDEAYSALYDGLGRADGIIIGSPVYFAGPTGALCAVLDRLFYSAGHLAAYKPAASVAVCRRGGASSTFDRLNKYFTIMSMPVVSSQYWNSVHGRTPGEVLQDEEGLQTMRTLGRNMAWMLRNLHGTRLPEQEQRIYTKFVR